LSELQYYSKRFKNQTICPVAGTFLVTVFTAGESGGASSLDYYVEASGRCRVVDAVIDKLTMAVEC
jgi:hypothetical protein